MGLDERVKQNDFASDPALQGWWGNKIDPAKAWQIAKDLKREPQLSYDASIILSYENNQGREPQKYANMRAKNLLRVAQKVYRVRNQENLTAYRRQITRDTQHFSPEDIDLCTLAIDIFNTSKQFPALIEQLTPKTTLHRMFRDDDIKNIMRRFNDNREPETTYDSIEYQFARNVMRWTSSALRNDPDAGHHFPKFAHLLNQLSREMNFGIRYNVEQDIILEKMVQGTIGIYTSTDSPPRPSKLTAKLNNSPKNLAYNNTDCCISGPYGKHRATALLYWLDPAVHTWEFYAEAEDDDARTDVIDQRLPFGLGIFVEARGRHHAAEKDTNYLIFEGLPANGRAYTHINGIDLWKCDQDNTMQFEHPDRIIKKRTTSLPELVYVLGLITAQAKGIPKLFINTGHSSHTQHSVRDSTNTIMDHTHNHEYWDPESQRLRRDPLSPDGAFGAFHVGASNRSYPVKAQRLQYTHFLAKPSFPSALSAEIINRDEETGATYWRGEMLLDTFYESTKFLGNTYDNWTKEARDAHPYAARIAARASRWRAEEVPPESFWNAGIGYCRGIEIDVQDELNLLKRGELHLLGRSSRSKPAK